MDKIEYHQKIKDGITNYTSKFTGKQLSSAGLDGLLSALSSSIGREITLKDVRGSFYDHTWHLDYFIKEEPVRAVSIQVKRENEAMERLAKLLGKPISQMDAGEMEQNVLRMFIMSSDEYKNLAEKAGIKLSDDFDKYHFEYNVDGLLLIGALKQIFRSDLSKDVLAQKIIEMDFGLGYFENIFKDRFEHDTKNFFDEKEGLDSLRENFQRNYSEERAKLYAHIQFDNELTAQHKIPAPQLLTDRTIHLDMTPLGIAFAQDNNLVVLGQVYKTKDGKEDAEHDLSLAVYDITTGKQLVSTNTKLPAAFDGAGGMAFNFQGSLSVGSNGIIYVGGYNKIQRFNSNLQPLEDNESKYNDAVQLLKNKNILTWDLGIFQVVERDEIHYFTLQPNHFPKCYDNVLVATDGEKMIGKLLGYSPSGGGGGTEFKDTAQIVVGNNDLYFKIMHSVLAVDRSLTEEVYKQIFKMVDEQELSSSCIPSNLSLDSSELLWVVTKLSNEVVSSIKAYKRGKERGEVVSHLYPENHPGGGPSMRSMAISSNGILAYTDFKKNQVDLYKI